ncbi:MAG: recombinase family protein, partial [Candidatus Peribacteraceae bacterium]|nr:recombinase family protein [Candidatus Peribacteraceae bacterium]
VRVSTEDQSVHQQMDAIKGECQAHGHEVIDFIADYGESGKNLDRPGIQDVLRRLPMGEAEGLIVAKLDRLTRSVRDLDRLLTDYFGPCAGGLALVSVAERIDTEHATGRFMLNVLMSVAQWERETIGERTRDALTAKARRGERTGGIPFGMQLAADGVHLEDSPEEQGIVLSVLKLRENGETQRGIVLKLEEAMALSPRSGKPLSLMQVQRILKRASTHVR